MPESTSEPDLRADLPALQRSGRLILVVAQGFDRATGLATCSLGELARLIQDPALARALHHVVDANEGARHRVATAMGALAAASDGAAAAYAKTDRAIADELEA